MDSKLSRAALPSAFKPLLFAVLLLLAALAAACAWLVAQRQNSLQREAELNRRLAQLNQTIASQRAALDDQQATIQDQQTALDQAQNAIELLEEYSLATPEGILPEYTRLFPELYAPAWEGAQVEGGKMVCLTFDDGPSANTDAILSILDQYGVKATFFVVGHTGERDQQRMRDIVDRGHTLAMHSWSHDYKKIYASVDAFLEDFDRLYQWIYEVTGVRPAVFRFPGGSLNGYDRGVYQEIVAEMTRRGFVYFDWNASAQDATATPRPAADIAADCLKGIGRDLVVVLSHDSAARGTTVQALPAVIEGYQAAGYTFGALHPGVKPVIMGYPVSK